MMHLGQETGFFGMFWSNNNNNRNNNNNNNSKIVFITREVAWLTSFWNCTIRPFSPWGLFSQTLFFRNSMIKSNYSSILGPITKHYAQNILIVQGSSINDVTQIVTLFSSQAKFSSFVTKIVTPLISCPWRHLWTNTLP